MAKPNENEKDVAKPAETVEVPLSILTKMQEDMAALERKVADETAARAGLEEIVSAQGGAATEGKEKLREKKTFEPAFRTVRIRKFPVKGGEPGYVIGWTNRGAYQEVDRSGVSPQIVDYLDVIFLGHERDEAGVLQAEKVRLLDLLNKGEQVFCKVLETKTNPHKDPTGEEINVTVFDPQHGLVATGDTIDGWVGYTDLQYVIQVPGMKDPVVIDGKYVNG